MIFDPGNALSGFFMRIIFIISMLSWSLGAFSQMLTEINPPGAVFFRNQDEGFRNERQAEIRAQNIRSCSKVRYLYSDHKKPETGSLLKRESYTPAGGLDTVTIFANGKVRYYTYYPPEASYPDGGLHVKEDYLPGNILLRQEVERMDSTNPGRPERHLVRMKRGRDTTFYEMTRYNHLAQKVMCIRMESHGGQYVERFTYDTLSWNAPDPTCDGCFVDSVIQKKFSGNQLETTLFVTLEHSERTAQKEFRLQDGDTVLVHLLEEEGSRPLIEKHFSAADPADSSVFYYTYNEKTSTKRVFSGRVGVWLVITTEIDPDLGVVISEEGRWEKTGDLEYRWERTFDRKGREKWFRRYKEDGALRYLERKYYDPAGNLIRKVYHGENEKPYMEDEYIYVTRP